MRKKIIFFTAKDLSNVGGGERVLSVLTSGLSERYEIIVVTPYISDSYYGFAGNVEVKTLGFSKPGKSIFRKLQLFKVIYRLCKLLNKEEYDFFVASSFMAIVLTSFASWGINNRLVAWIHTSFYQKEPFFLKEYFLKTLNKFIVISTNTMDVDNYKRYAKRVHLLYNPLSFHIENKSTTKNKRIISVGRLTKPKGFDQLIKICSKSFRSIDEWRLDIYGQDDGEKENLLALIKQEGMQDRIHIFPPTKNIHQELVDSSVFVFCSHIECFGLVLLEACECGLPCIAYNSPSGIRDIVKDGYNGYLVEQYDQEAFSDALLKLLQDNELRKQYGNNAANFALKFTDSEILKQWYDLFG